MSFSKAVSALLIVSVCCFSAITTASAQNTITIMGRVQFNPIIKVFPERRDVLPNNLQNANTVDIRSEGSTTPMVSQNVETDGSGIGHMNGIDVASLPSGHYDIAVKGFSHLRKVYLHQQFKQAVTLYDLTAAGEHLKAGDTVSDNTINILDMTNQGQNLYTNTLKNDLNRDGYVNSLDMSNLAYNFYDSGDN